MILEILETVENDNIGSQLIDLTQIIDAGALNVFRLDVEKTMEEGEVTFGQKCFHEIVLFAVDDFENYLW